jgi:hypothetical protein
VPSKILIRAGEYSIPATLNNNLTANKIFEALPFEGKGNRWGDEIYFTIPVTVDEADDARQEMAVGELAYWPSGSAFCIFFGPTPVSIGDVPRAYTNVNPFGNLDEDPSPLKNVPDGEVIKIEKLET